VIILATQIYGYVPKPLEQGNLVVLDIVLLLVNLAIIRGDLRVLFQATPQLATKEEVDDHTDDELVLLLKEMEDRRIYRLM
jgi:hypothetical protein